MGTPTNEPAAFSTERLDLLPLRPAYAEEMARVLSDPGLHTFIGGSPASVDELRSRYTRQAAGSPDPAVTWWNWVIRLRTEGVLAGTVQATVQGPVAEIAWVVGTPWQGRGIAKEAAAGLVELLGEVPGVRDVIAHIHPDHAASAAVAGAVGLGPTGQWQDGEARWRWSPPHGAAA
ncbi:GNAT family N-acetyltransferase [Streptomyces sp. SID10853]|uniref:GNAT family N-acetyltransferase n=1 Tax=Streptomyces sp. SID10853 TaxID=2706028 RepID=UPI0013C08F60|nr:GNAT family N-acetyltransferase [Streptomyces sp. SID10853]NDZ81060.1 GNAT family N-acetyltransferase [Streptomyces sp. SID10853]